MKCQRCSQPLPDGAQFCPACGKRAAQKKSVKTRGNGQGCAYKDKKTGKWVAQIIDGYREPADKSHQPIPIKKTKGGFTRKIDALAYCAKLREKKPSVCTLTLQQLYEEWEPWYTPRVDPDTFGCYRAAFKHFQKLNSMLITDIVAKDLQDCMDACELGHRTHQNMKCTAGLLWKYAMDQNYVARNVAENLFIGKGKSVKREPLTEEEVEKIKEAIPSERYAEYIYALCYLGFRPGEMLEIRKDQVTKEGDNYFITEGKKTDAGRNRIVPVHRNIVPIIERRLKVEGTDLLFPMYLTGKNGALKGFKEMRHEYLNKQVFQPLMARLGIAEGKVPYSARHTFSDKLKKASGTDADKAKLIGHTDYLFTQEKYQSTSKQDLKDIVDSMK